MNKLNTKILCVWDDTKKSNTFKEISCTKDDEFYQLAKEYNENNKLAVGYCINDTPQYRRRELDIPKYCNILIDIDIKDISKDEWMSEYNKMDDYLLKNKIKYSYSEESANGFHFLIPVDITNKDVVKNFLTNLKNNVTKYTDSKLISKSQICRLPESINWKNPEDPFKLRYISENINLITEEDIKTNSVNINNLFHTRKDFFHNMLTDPNIIKKIKNKKSAEKNNVLLRNLAIYINKSKDPSIEALGLQFVKDIDHDPKELMGWLKKEELTYINYNEMVIWINKHNIDIDTPNMDQDLSYLENYRFYILNSDSSFIYMEEEKETTKHTRAGIKNLLYLKGLRLNMDFTESVKKIIGEYLDDNIQIYHDLIYRPTIERDIVKNNLLYLNTYKESEIIKNYNKEAIVDENLFPNVKLLILNLVGKNEENYMFFNKWLAFQLQYPLIKLATSFVFKGTQGTGKGTLSELVLKKIFGNNNLGLATPNTLSKGWGSYIENKRIIICEEVYINKNTSAYDMVKDYSVNPTVNIEKKGKDEYSIENYSHWLFFTNRENPFPIERGDRRHTIFHQDNKLKPEIYENINNNPMEVISYFNYLMSLNVEKSEVNRTLLNQDKLDMIEQNLDPVEKFLIEIREYKTMIEFCESININLANRISDYEKTNRIIHNNNLFGIFEDWIDKNRIQRYKHGIKAFSERLKKLGVINIKGKNNQNAKMLVELVKEC